MTEIVYPNQNLIPSYYECLKQVASEKRFIELLEPPPLDKVIGFQMSLVLNNGPVFYAVDNGKVVGWCDVFPEENPRHSHRGGLGMGILPEYRGKGIGSRLLDAVLKKAKEFRLEKVELNVYTSNKNAIKLYKKFGFVEEGQIRNYRKLDGEIFDALLMAKFLDC